jgi:ribonucleotide monophosphatase NagD (HAD superfamily)
MSDFLLLSSTTGFQNFKILDSIFETAIKLQLPLICSNPDILGISGDNIHPSTGDLAIKYKRMGGVAFVIGKPGLEIFQYAYELSQCEKSKILMIGDSLFNDIAGANSFKIDSLLIKSGIHRKEFLQNMNDEDIIGEIKSDYQITGFPEYIMERLQ